MRTFIFVKYKNVKFVLRELKNFHNLYIHTREIYLTFTLCVDCTVYLGVKGCGRPTVPNTDVSPRFFIGLPIFPIGLPAGQAG